jgi:sortase A
MRDVQSEKYEVPEGLRLSRMFWGLAWIWAGRLLLVLGLVFLAGYATARFESWVSTRALLKNFATSEQTASVGIEGREDGKEAASDAGATQHGENVPLAVLTIPGIGLTVPVLDGTDELTLNHAAGRIRGTAPPGEQGNIGIAGHRDGTFRGLRKVSKGEVIELKTAKGESTYVVDRIRIVSPDEVSVLQPDPTPSLTLVTCYPFYYIGSAPNRFIVKATLTKTTEPGLSSVDIQPTVITK